MRSIQGILDQHTYRWLFVGGKGGVGKTTTSSALALRMAETRPEERFLLISTDPAHNLSDAFNQQFGPEPSVVEGVRNLYVAEINPTDEMAKITESIQETSTTQEVQEAQDLMSFNNMLKSLTGFLKDGAIGGPGMDEFVFFSKVIKLVESVEYSAVIFDTAPTGHTLRFLGLPETMKKLLKTVLEIRSNMSGVLNMITSMMGTDSTGIFEMLDRVQPILSSVERVCTEFRDPSLCTFIAVCIPEFLSIYETERLVQQLAVLDMDCHTVIVNFLLDANENSPCFMCRSRALMQQKYIDQLLNLYDDFDLVMSPLRPAEVRGLDGLRDYGRTLVEPVHFCWSSK